ncbi:hypothetical protein DICPUDRAFT_154434 [Dictyostelium purpureum]|uniref:tRNA(Ile)-lysidine/2-thiocytidine synthase N-terminal domain-containing protein n=1 Tax=Dictyostelium purpureum TaxID=5786 RepID=F0ZRB4_DICPU|nr:uncharacterized protein DICPUDRAFT_154434 [Dictyostelium purpureum]EGC33533.1 hypothetical protein DICPUDRAFT_154434 [Dictyostelium purpureum]|eukprot:XP_003289958.1 hypothetical protein DICPUDRAFT_154434 [Dictyostelium purpureum]
MNEKNNIRDFSDEYFIENKNLEKEENEILHKLKSTNITQPSPKATAATETTINDNKKINLINSSYLDIVGVNDLIDTPFGEKLLSYNDFTASGKSLKSIEEYLLHEVLPLYANTHTLSDATGLQTTLFRREAREIIKRCCRGSNVDDVLLFVGSGATSAVNHLVHLLNIKELCRDNKDSVVVILGPYEHHSNILPWREAGAKILTCPEDTLKGGGSDLKFLENCLKQYRSKDELSNSNTLIIGSFSAASNVSGILEDTIAITELLKQYNALSFWDYACAAPYIPIDMNPLNDSRFKKDAIFFSPTSGGSVLYVTSDSTTYLGNFEEREEAGTPEIIGSIRCGLIFQLREHIGIDTIKSIEMEHSQYFRSRLRSIKNLVVLGGDDKDEAQSTIQRLPIISFLIRYEPDPTLFLHHNFISSLLNDLFGIQTRASCACAGPYLECLLGLSKKDNKELLESIFEKQEVIRPGMVRLNVNFTMSYKEIDFLVQALEFVSNHGWKFLPLYTFVVASGEWKHRSKLTKMFERRWLSSINYSQSGKLSFNSKRKQLDLGQCNTDQDKINYLLLEKFKYLDQANILLKQLISNQPKILPDQSSMLTKEANSLRWFALPTDSSNKIKLLNDINNSAVFENEEIYNGLLKGSTVISSTINREVIIKPHKNYIPGTLDLNNNELTNLLIKFNNNLNDNNNNNNNNIINQFIYQQQNNQIKQQKEQKEQVLQIEQVLERELKEPIEKENDGMMCPLKPKKDIEGLVKSRICINCFHDHIGVTNGKNQNQNNNNNNDNNQNEINQSKECLSCNCISFIPRLEGNKKEKVTIQKKVHSNVCQSIQSYGMINEGDKIMVGVSGGKDSLTLINTLIDIKRRSKVKFTIGACTVDPQSPDYDPSPLKKYFASIGIPYFYVSQSIMETAKCIMKEGNKESICAFCSRMRRGILYNTCRKEGYNVLALGQHLNDLSESFLMSALYNGILSTMKVNYLNEQGDIRIIRPLCNISENQTRHYAKVMGLPVIDDNCPACFQAPVQRSRIKLLLAKEENLNPNVHHILFKTMQPLFSVSKTNRVSKRSIDNYSNGLIVDKNGLNNNISDD